VLGYQLKRPIGVGGMGIVYEAEEVNIGRRAAVKVLLPEVADQPQLVERLKAEARAANAARHRGIVDIFGFATLPDGRQAIVMEYLEGIALEEHLATLATEGRRVPVMLALLVLDEVAAVLQAAHDARVIHRDLKPSNIFLCTNPDGSQYVKVLDFGIAKLDGLHTGPKTAANIVMGTPSYMSPEQARGDAAAPSMDLYSLGVLGFELFTGRPPFIDASTVKLLMAHQQDTPPTPSSLAPSLPAIVDAFLLKLLEKNPDARYRSGNEVRAAVQQLRRVLGDREATVTAPELDPAPPTARTIRVTPLPTRSDEAVIAPLRRSPAVWLLALGLSLLVVGLAYLVFRPEPVATVPPLAEPALPTPTATREEDAGAAPVAVIPTTLVPEEVPPDAGAPTPGGSPTRPTGLSPLETRKRALERRLGALAGKLQAASARGDSVTLETQQLNALKKGLKSSKDMARLDAVETAIQRLEEETP